MILTIDIGNSNIVTAVYKEDGKRVADDRCETLREDDKDKQFLVFESIKKRLEESENIGEIDTIVLSCVVPYIKDSVKLVLKELYKLDAHDLKASMITDMDVDLDDPDHVGSDLVAANVGAHKKYEGINIIADLGSASKINVVDENFSFTGCVIMPGIYFQAVSIHNMIPHLPMIEIKKPKSILGFDTNSCIQSGIINGTFASIVQLSEEIEEQMGEKCNRILTGGLAKLFLESDLRGFIYDEWLVSDGLYFVARDYIKSDENKIKEFNEKYSK